LNDFRASLLGGDFTAHGTMKNISGDSRSDLYTELRGASLSDLTRAFGLSTSTVNGTISGKLNADTTVSWGKTLDDLLARTDATIIGQFPGGQITHKQTSLPSLFGSGAGQTLSSAIPLESAIHATYASKTGQVSFDNCYLRTPQTNLTIDGLASSRSRLNLRLQANDLSELETVADLFRTPSAKVSRINKLCERAVIGAEESSSNRHGRRRGSG
jgi:hypothetical protein